MAQMTITLHLRVARWVDAYVDAMQRIGAGGGEKFVAAVSMFVLDRGIRMENR